MNTLFLRINYAMTRFNEENCFAQSLGTESRGSSISLAPRSVLVKSLRPKSKSLQPCRCPTEGCGKMFSKRSNLKAHMRVHSGVLPYPCSYPGCEKRFRWKSSLKPHIKVHLASGHILDKNSDPEHSEDLTVPPIVSKLAETLFHEDRFGDATTQCTQETMNISSPGLQPDKLFVDLASTYGEASPTAVMNSSFFVPAKQHNGTCIAKDLACSLQRGFGKYSSTSSLTGHASESYHQNTKPHVSRALFQDSTQKDVEIALNDVDLRCDSVLSGSEHSCETDVVSFTLGSSLEEGSTQFNDALIPEELWNHDLTVADPFDFPSLAFGPGNKTIDMLSSVECSSDISASSLEPITLPGVGDRWLLRSEKSTAPGAEYAESMYTE